MTKQSGRWYFGKIFTCIVAAWILPAVIVVLLTPADNIDRNAQGLLLAPVSVAFTLSALLVGLWFRFRNGSASWLTFCGAYLVLGMLVAVLMVSGQRSGGGSAPADQVQRLVPADALASLGGSSLNLDVVHPK